MYPTNHKLSVVYGGGWGSEGKGQIAAFIAQNDGCQILSIRVGGPNAGHTITGADGKVRKVQQIPCAAYVRPTSVNYIGCSGMIIPEILERELDWLKETYGDHGYMPQLIIDPQAVIITPEHMALESGDLVGRISSTGEGVGAATADKVMRKQGITVAEYMEFNQPFAETLKKHGVQVISTQGHMLQMLSPWMLQKHLIVEGTQGYMLSLNASGGYPFVTSRDCGPEALMGQIGISFRTFNPSNTNVICTMRTYPIRVGGPSGPLPNEMTWEEMSDVTGGYIKVPETTTVTGKARRIGGWDWMTANKVIHETRPTSVALTFIDYIDPSVAGVTKWEQLPMDVKNYVLRMSNALGVPIEYISTGPNATIHIPFPF